MNRILIKRHKRQVARAKQRVKLSEPDVRTSEQLAAAREASRAVSTVRSNPHANYSRPTVNSAARAEDSTSKEEAGS